MIFGNMAFCRSYKILFGGAYRTLLALFATRTKYQGPVKTVLLCHVIKQIATRMTMWIALADSLCCFSPDGRGLSHCRSRYITSLIRKCVHRHPRQ